MRLKEYQALSHPFTFPGGYTMYALMDDGETLCHQCCCENKEVHEGNEYDPQWQFVDVYIHWEGPAEICSHCGTELPSEYGDPDES